MPAIVADLDTSRHPLQIAIQNWEHDFNIGSIVRTANAFNVGGVHILGRRRWNRRGAMVTDRYLHVAAPRRRSPPSPTGWPPTATSFVGVDNLPGAVPLETTELPERVCLVFGSEGPGLTDELVAVCDAAGRHHSVRLHPLPQCRCGGSHRDVPLGAAAGPASHGSPWALLRMHVAPGLSPLQACTALHGAEELAEQPETGPTAELVIGICGGTRCSTSHARGRQTLGDALGGPAGRARRRPPSAPRSAASWST